MISTCTALKWNLTFQLRAENITMSGRLQACEFEHSELVSSVDLKARNNEDMYFISKLASEDRYFFDLYYYQP